MAEDDAFVAEDTAAAEDEVFVSGDAPVDEVQPEEEKAAEADISGDDDEEA